MPPERWRALDAVKAAALAGTLLSHVFIWRYGENLGPGAVVYRLDPGHAAAAAGFMGFVFVLLAASGAAFRFSLERGRPAALAGRVVLLLAAGLLLGLNLHPFRVLWNVFGFYAASLLLLALLRRAGWAGVAACTAACFLLTPPLRRGLGGAAYWTAVLVGDPDGLLSFFPLFPWFSLLGLGWLAAELRERRRDGFRRQAAAAGALLALGGLPFLSPLDFSNVFGTTARVPLAYPVFFGGLFLCLLALCDALLEGRPLPPLHPIDCVGRHPLAVYLVTLLAMLAVMEKLPGRGGGPGFLALNVLALAVMLGTGALLEAWRLRRSRATA